MDVDHGRDAYIRQVLDAYRNTPGTAGAVELYRRGVPLEAVENAFVLAATRRLFRPPDAMALGTIRSLAYFLPVIEEVLELKIGRDYFSYLRYKLRQIGAIR